MAAQSFAYYAHETVDRGRCCYPWLVCHDIKSAMHCSLRLAPTMISHLTSNSQARLDLKSECILVSAMVHLSQELICSVCIKDSEG